MIEQYIVCLENKKNNNFHNSRNFSMWVWIFINFIPLVCVLLIKCVKIK